MKKKILFFESNAVLRIALLDQIIINKDFDVIQSNSLEDVKCHIEQSPIDLLIIGEDGVTHSLSSIMKFIKEEVLGDEMGTLRNRVGVCEKELQELGGNITRN